MKRISGLLILCVIALIVYIERDPIVEFISKKILENKEIIIPANNHYALNQDFAYLQITDDFFPTNKQDLKNIIYTYLDHGWDTFTFYCSPEYQTCIEDVKDIAQDATLLSDINNFVHPYNSYNKLYITVNNLGEITIQKDALYTKEEIQQLNDKINTIINELNLTNKSDQEKLKAIHDYIINHSIYDTERAELIKAGKTDDIKYPSHKAIGPLLNGMGLCSGYSDAFALFLNQLNIKNYKISSPTHVWNAIYLNGTWYHTDLTWDDPVVSNHENVLLEEYFLIDTPTLEAKDLSEHAFDKNIYIELKG